ncbi:type VI secretion system baseplate subunit TssG [Derxia gummosa]|uniref:Type VI secretion system baseplate subunit TssG n=1 Tax=Derxia gummosa DSM 723 TaxID=1121388 RepID=A0A8B6XAX1_9BURK|nr:type VI secretion system baseplate subunit TssG [Derxia gummosa]
MWHSGPGLTLARELAATPWRFDYFMALRRLECTFARWPRLGTARLPKDEPLRLGQEPALDFAPAALAGFTPAEGDRAARLTVRFFGLFGPQGPLPLHLTEYAHERRMHYGDATFARFADLFHHRMLLLFYRAWAQAQPTVALDRPGEDRFATYVGSLIGIGVPPARNRDALPDAVRLHFAALLARQTRNADGLAAMVRGYFRLPASIEEYVGHWLDLPERERSRLGHGFVGRQIGTDVVLGRRVWDRQFKFRLHVGPLTRDEYEDMLPGGKALDELRALLRHYLSFELDWDVRLALRADEVPQVRLGLRTRLPRESTSPSVCAGAGRPARLGWTTWLGRRRAAVPARDLVLDPEARRTAPRPPIPPFSADVIEPLPPPAAAAADFGVPAAIAPESRSGVAAEAFDPLFALPADEMNPSPPAPA